MAPTPPHYLYLTNKVWGELLKQAALEETDASKLLTYLLEAFLKAPRDLPLPQRRLRSKSLESMRRHAVYIPPEVWEAVSVIAGKQAYSISVLAEVLAREYLGLEITPDLLKED